MIFFHKSDICKMNKNVRFNSILGAGWTYRVENKYSIDDNLGDYFPLKITNSATLSNFILSDKKKLLLKNDKRNKKRMF